MRRAMTLATCRCPTVLLQNLRSVIKLTLSSLAHQQMAFFLIYVVYVNFYKLLQQHMLPLILFVVFYNKFFTFGVFGRFLLSMILILTPKKKKKMMSVVMLIHHKLCVCIAWEYYVLHYELWQTCSAKSYHTFTVIVGTNDLVKMHFLNANKKNLTHIMHHDKDGFTWLSLFILCCFCWFSNSKSDARHHQPLSRLRGNLVVSGIFRRPRKSLCSPFRVGGRQVRICFGLNSPACPRAPRCRGR